MAAKAANKIIVSRDNNAIQYLPRQEVPIGAVFARAEAGDSRVSGSSFLNFGPVQESPFASMTPDGFYSLRLDDKVVTAWRSPKSMVSRVGVVGSWDIKVPDVSIIQNTDLKIAKRSDLPLSAVFTIADFFSGASPQLFAALPQIGPVVEDIFGALDITDLVNQVPDARPKLVVHPASTKVLQVASYVITSKSV